MANVTSSIKLKRATGSITDVPSNGTLSEGEFAINLLSGKLYYGTRFGTHVSSSLELDYFTASFLTVSSTASIKVAELEDLYVTNTASVTYLHTTYESSSIIYASGSTKFGDTRDDTHQRTGSMFISGGLTMGSGSIISASGITSSIGGIFISGVSDYFGGEHPLVGPGYIGSGSLTAEGPISFHKVQNLSASIFTTQSTSLTPVVLAVSGNLVVEKNPISNNGGDLTVSGTIEAGEDITTPQTGSFGSISSSADVFATGGTGSFAVVSASEYIGVEQTKYKTGSADLSDLLKLEILNFDTNVFVTSDSSSGRLILQFGEASLPTVELKVTGNTASIYSNLYETTVDSDFNPNRFSEQSQSAFMWQHSISDVPASVEILTHSFYVNGIIRASFQMLSGSQDFGNPNASSFVYYVIAPGEKDPTDQTNNTVYNLGKLVQSQSTAGGGWNVKSFTSVGAGDMTSGSSNSITASYIIKDGAGNIVTMSNSHSFEIDKGAPTSSITLTFGSTGLQGGSEFVTGETGTGNMTIENGITGSITYTTNSLDDPSNFWRFDKTTAGAGDTTPFTIEETGSTNTFNITANYTSSGALGVAPTVLAGAGFLYNRWDTISSGSGTPDSNNSIVRNRSIIRRTSVRTFCSPTASFTENELWDIKGIWTSSVFSGSIKFTSTTNPNGQTYNIPIPAEDAYPAGLYVWIVYDGNLGDITALTQNGSPALANWAKVHDYPTYKAYRTNLLQSEDAGSDYAITI